jgi:hypothetical protein
VTRRAGRIIRREIRLYELRLVRTGASPRFRGRDVKLLVCQLSPGFFQGSLESSLRQQRRTSFQRRKPVKLEIFKLTRDGKERNIDSGTENKILFRI